MRQIRLGRTGLEASCLGFGCASLGSRVGRTDGLRALDSAFESGVTWFDLAPAYGLGRAEEIAATFLKGKRVRVLVATKVGLVAPEKTGRVASAFLPIARRAVGAVPQLRRVLRRAGIQANRKLSLTPQLLRTSLDGSLRRLGTDYVDVYALHNAGLYELGRDDLRRTLEDILSAGKARTIAVASDEQAARVSLLDENGPVSVIQIPLPPQGESTAILSEARSRGAGTVVHSVFGVEDRDSRLLAQINSNRCLQNKLADATGTGDPRTALARLRLARAFALVPDGVVLASMFSEHNLRENLALATGSVPAQAADFFDRLAGTPHDHAFEPVLPGGR